MYMNTLYVKQKKKNKKGVFVNYEYPGGNRVQNWLFIV